jgi:hypothetical protein
MNKEREFVCSVTGRPCKCDKDKGCTKKRNKK